MNPSAQSLTNWSLEKAKERPIEEVFPIVNEKTLKAQTLLCGRTSVPLSIYYCPETMSGLWDSLSFHVPELMYLLRITTLLTSHSKGVFRAQISCRDAGYVDLPVRPGPGSAEESDRT
jgi:hypothetical protein